jgi:exopolysaccharide/PEP-CTERM locus tyrosine autokinase
MARGTLAAPLNHIDFRELVSCNYSLNPAPKHWSRTMGKFFKALNKSKAEKSYLADGTLPKKDGKITADAMESLRFDTEAPTDRAKVPTKFNGRIDPLLISVHEPQSPVAEEFKMLRAKILCKSLTCRHEAIMVTSAQPLDGKSLVAANLAVSIAQGINEHVLLVDCDLRLPSLHQYFGLQVHHGLREYLEDGTSIAPYLSKTPLRKLTLLPGGNPPPNPSELLSSEKMRLLIQELKKRYQDRFVIFDSTPAQFSAETASLTPEMDTVLLVVHSGKTPREAILEAVDNIDREKILGVVFNASNENKKSYRTYYRHYTQASTKDL